MIIPAGRGACISLIVAEKSFLHKVHLHVEDCTKIAVKVADSLGDMHIMLEKPTSILILQLAMEPSEVSESADDLILFLTVLL